MKTRDVVEHLRSAEREVRGLNSVVSFEVVQRMMQLASARVSAMTGIPVLLTLTNDYNPEKNPLRELVTLTVEVDKQ